MEEILASIRRIISDEGAPGGAAPAADKAGPPLEAPEEILDLTPAMEVEAPIVDKVVPPPSPAPAPSMEKLMASFGTDPEPTAPAPYVHEAPPSIVDKPYIPDTPVVSKEGPMTIISPQTEASAASALAGLKALSGNSKFEGGTVEALVREMLKPMMKEWLDAHLPAIVERIVEAEIQRVSRLHGGGHG